MSSYQSDPNVIMWLIWGFIGAFAALLVLSCFVLARIIRSYEQASRIGSDALEGYRSTITQLLADRADDPGVGMAMMSNERVRQRTGSAEPARPAEADSKRDPLDPRTYDPTKRTIRTASP